MTYDDFIELLGDYCENNISMSTNSFFNTLIQLIEDNIIICNRTDKSKTAIKDIKDRNFKEMSYACRDEAGFRYDIKGLCINVYSTKTSKSSSVLISLKENNEVRIRLISTSVYSGELLYMNKKEVNKYVRERN